MRKQFDLNYYLAHPETKVVTRGGNNVRIICTDRKSPLCGKNIVALISHEKNSESVCSYTSKGEPTNTILADYDLFFDLPTAKKKVPLTYKDLLERVKAGKPMWFVNNRDTVFNIVDFDFEFVYVINGDTREVVPFQYKELMNGMTFVDNTQCWKEVEE